MPVAANRVIFTVVIVKVLAAPLALEGVPPDQYSVTAEPSIVTALTYSELFGLLITLREILSPTYIKALTLFPPL